MNKRKYIAPAVEVVEMGSISMFAGSVQNGGQIGGDFDEEFEEELSNKRRGQWGNLWAED